ncbi:MAG: helix-turn-helix transcriptional regulator [Marinospirillum sp.]|uniref:helix-turn-helix transcriptional regulator n=1 Tax=Marinospirillum sp. TaxID=2183934 RepID=UPI0019DBDCD8|nr:helix-turn-helix transcriptional regulator [Marinospirillum sp.]MBE0507491.1 helix-turn-helix transcriptional regulator [Marinospirillum sp.]
MSARQHIGEQVCAARKRLSQTQKQMAETTGIHKSTLSEIENGRFTGSLDILERYLDAVGLKLTVAEKVRRLPDWDELDELFGDDS